MGRFYFSFFSWPWIFTPHHLITQMKKYFTGDILLGLVLLFVHLRSRVRENFVCLYLSPQLTLWQIEWQRIVLDAYSAYLHLFEQNAGRVSANDYSAGANYWLCIQLAFLSGCCIIIRLLHSRKILFSQWQYEGHCIFKIMSY